MKWIRKIIIPLCSAFLSLLIVGCRKDKLIEDSSAKLSFSTDSILYDTVFTTVGSTTKRFTVHNTHKNPIKVSSIYIAGGKASNYRMNVDGLAGIAFENIEIPAEDSIFVFVEVTVDPNNKNTPLVVRDAIVFNTNGNEQQVILEAWGQDAHYHRPLPGNKYLLVAQNETWANDKPHVVYGLVIVDSAFTLTMQAGARIHMHGSSILLIYKDASLKILGTATNKVIIQGDRLEPVYANIPGQWNRIWLYAGSKDNIVDWAVIKNGSVGLHVDTVGSGGNPTLRISNTFIYNMDAAALFAQGAKIRAHNCIFANCGQYVALLDIGGNYRFSHCTFANYWTESSRQTPSLLIRNWYKDVNEVIQSRSIDSAYFGNCIVHGSLSDEVKLDSAGSGSFNVVFENTLLKTAQSVANTFHYKTVWVNEDPVFKDEPSNDFQIVNGSAAIDRGKVILGNIYPKDIKDAPRNIDAAPDLGAFEK